jgi:putative DNA primase/helicase
MSADTDRVARILDAAEDVSLPEGMQAPDAQDADAPHPDSDDPGPDDADFDAAGYERDHGQGDGPPPPDGPDPDDLREAAGFDRNDLGNGQRFVLHFGEDVIFVPRVGWHVWDDRVWQVDPDMIATRSKAQRLSKLIVAELPFITLNDEKMKLIAEGRQIEDDLRNLRARLGKDDETDAELKPQIYGLEAKQDAIAALKKSLQKLRGAHITFARSSGNSAKIKAAMTEAEVPLAVKVEDLDTRPLDVNTESSVIRFNVTPRKDTWPLVEVEHLGHERDLRMTKIMATGFDPAASAPIFQAFLDRIQPDPKMQAFLQRWFGYSMLGLTNEQALAFFYGMGANGKSALTDLMARLMGSYAATAKIESLTGQNRRSGGDATPDLISIVAARMVRASEPERGVQWQEGLIKQLTGGEPILVRALNENFFEATPIFKLTIGGNHAPDIRGMDDGIWRRLMIVPFNVQIPKAERDPLIVTRMLAEGPGILNWLIEGARAYLELGLAPPTEVSNATDELRQDADPYGKFLDDACVVTGDLNDSISSRELTLCFQFWQMRRGETPFKDRTVSTNMKDHSRRWRSPATGKQFAARETGRFNGYDGVRLTDFFEAEWKAAAKDVNGRAIGTAASASARDDDRDAATIPGDSRDF